MLALSGTVAPGNATNKAIVWSIKDAGGTGASLSGTTLTTSAAGTVVVTAAIADGTAVGIDYTQDLSIAIIVPVTGITGVSANGTVGAGLPLSGTVEPANATNKAIVWTVKNTGRTGATISGDTLTTTAAGTVVVTASIANGTAIGTAYAQDFSIAIIKFVAVSRITGVSTIEAAETPLVLSGTVEPADATKRSIVWTVKNAGETGATISGTTLTTTAKGTVVVTATIAGGAAAGADYAEDFSIAISYPFAAPAQHREMVLATPDAVNSVTIVGDEAYGDGVFIKDRTVILSPFKIAKYETTYELWYEVKEWAKEHGYTFANEGRPGLDSTSVGAVPGANKTMSVTYVNWRDMVIWCNAYSEMDGKEPVYYTDSTYDTVVRISEASAATYAVDGAVIKPGAKGYRLPTEAQWEYAARGGGTPSTTGSFADKYAGTNDESDLWRYAWYMYYSGNIVHPVGQRQANRLGLYDMSGNVWDVCWDLYIRPVVTGTVTDPDSGIDTAVNNRVARGGVFNNSSATAMVSNRFSITRHSRGAYLGFRVACLP
jgi:formylglycine-generating enzyme required for sulfatase activity